MSSPRVSEVLAELAALDNPKFREMNARHGDDHGVNLSDMRAVARRLKTDDALARELWRTGNTAARLLSLLICRPKNFDAHELDTMLREGRIPKVNAWLVSYVIKKSAHAEEMRLRWLSDPDEVVASAGWALTSDLVSRNPEVLDLVALLDTIESQMKAAPERLQWAMNTCLAHIGIEHVEYRERAISIGERLGVLKDYPTPPNCTSPYAPLWIAEMVKRQSTAKKSGKAS
ncbi:MAG: DNA alkylation repair protein [Terrimesophilobacter sp.]